MFVPQPTCCRAMLLLLLFPHSNAKPLLLLPACHGAGYELMLLLLSPYPPPSSTANVLYVQLRRSSMGKILGRSAAPVDQSSALRKVPHFLHRSPCLDGADRVVRHEHQ